MKMFFYVFLSFTMYESGCACSFIHSFSIFIPTFLLKFSFVCFFILTFAPWNVVYFSTHTVFKARAMTTKLGRTTGREWPQSLMASTLLGGVFRAPSALTASVAAAVDPSATCHQEHILKFYFNLKAFGCAASRRGPGLPALCLSDSGAARSLFGQLKLKSSI